MVFQSVPSTRMCKFWAFEIILNAFVGYFGPLRKATEAGKRANKVLKVSKGVFSSCELVLVHRAPTYAPV